MTLRLLCHLGLICSLACCGFGLAWGDEPRRPPNIVLILADDFGYELVGANGGASYSTPALDRLASTGMRFEHCYAQPLCTPTRVSLLTGLYNQRNYIRFGLLDPRARTFPQALRDAGYRTCIAGKWQLGGGPEAPQRFGFDEHLLWHFSRRGPRYANPVLERGDQVIEHKGGEYGPDLVNDFLCDFIRRNRERPFFVLHSMLLTHAPFEPTPGSPDWDPRAAGGGERGDVKHFPAMVAHADKLVGKLTALLEELGLRESTLVLFTGDNGTARAITSRFLGRDVRGGKGEMTDAGTRVPLIASWPGVIPAGARSTDLVDSTDFFPTVLDAARVAVPQGLAIDGRSFLPSLRGEKGGAREWIYSWYSRDGGAVGRELARDQRFKLYSDGRFYEVAIDPEESRDLSKGELSNAAAEARERLRKALERYRGTRMALSETPERDAAGVEQDVQRIEMIGGTVFRRDGRVVEVLLNRREATDEHMSAIAAFKGLTDLSLEETAVGDAGMERISGLQRLEWLNLYRTRVGDDGLRALCRIESLRMLPIGETRVTDAGLAHLPALARLEYLGLRGNKITDSGLEHVGKLTTLKGLHLGGTGVTDAGLSRLEGLQKLEKLWLNKTAITDAAVASLAKLKSLRELQVGETKLTPSGLEALRKALSRCLVEVE